MESIILSIYKLGGIKFDKNYITKSGKIHPIYINLRVCYGSPDLSDQLANAFNEFIKTDIVTGVPTGALHITSIIAYKFRKKMILVRGQSKNYGLMNDIEGPYTKGENVTVIEDIVTTGESIDNIEKILLDNGLNVSQRVCFLNYYKGDYTALTSIEEICNCLYKYNFMDINTKFNICNFFNPFKKVDLSKIRFIKLEKIMREKRSRVIVALDVCNDKAISLMKLLAPVVCGFKFHFDIDNYDIGLIKEIAEKGNCILINDRKYADVYDTNKLIPTVGDIVISHIIQGETSLLNVPTLLVMEMSTSDHLFTDEYIQECYKIGVRNKNVIGFIAQKKWWKDDELVCVTPGIGVCKQINGQKYTGIKETIKNGTDLLVIGKYITEAYDAVKIINEINDITEIL